VKHNSKSNCKLAFNVVSMNKLNSSSMTMQLADNALKKLTYC